MTLSDNARAGLVGLGGAIVAFFVFGGASLRGGPSDPLDAAPKSSFLVGTVDMEDLRRSPVYQALAGKDARPFARGLGLGKVADACGFDPLARVQRLAVAVPEDGERGEFGLAARVEVSKSELETCTRALAKERGGSGETRQVGSFAVLEASGPSRIAYGRGGLLVVGKGTWLDTMLRAADKTEPGVKDAPEHAALRSAITSREGWRSPTLVATAILPRSLRDRLKRDMASEADPSSITMAGVLGVSAVGVAMKAGAPGQRMEASVELACDAVEQCASVEKLIQKKRLDWSKDLTLRLAGLGALIDSLEVKHEGLRVRATVNADADALAAAVERITKLRGSSAEPPSMPRRPLRLPPPADETVPSKDGKDSGW